MNVIELPDPQLSDEVIRLRPWGGVDADDLVAAWGDPEVQRFTAVPAERDLAAARRWINGDFERRQAGLSLDLVISPLEGNDVLGEVGLSSFAADGSGGVVGYWVASTHRASGYATRALELVSDWAADALGLKLILARCHADNTASHRVAENAGYELVRTDPSGQLLFVRRVGAAAD